MGTNSIRGVFPSLKMKNPVHYQSLLERDYILLLEYAPDVRQYWTSPFTFIIKKRRIVPAFLVVRNDHEIVVECTRVRQGARQTENRRLAAIKSWCLEKGIEYEEVTDEVIRSGCLLENVKYLHRFAHYPIVPGLKVKINKLIAQIGTPSVEDVVDAFESNDRVNAYTTLMNMIWNHEISLSLERTPIPRMLTVRE